MDSPVSAMSARAADPAGVYRCVVNAWQVHGGELRNYLLHRLGDAQLAEELLQETFVKAMHHGRQFCELGNARAWLFQVARNALVDHWRAAGRLQAELLPLDDELPAPEPASLEPVDALSSCLSRVLTELAPADAQILRACEFDGLTVKVFAEGQGLSLSAAKARLLRARQRLRQQMTQACQVRFDDSGRVAGHIERPPVDLGES